MSHPDFPVRIDDSEDRYPIIDRRDAPEELFKRHHRYKLSHQAIPKTVPLYIREHHPDANEYLRFRAFFEQLLWAANSAARFYSWESPSEYVECWSPGLGVRKEANMSPPRDWEAHVALVKAVALDDENSYLSYPSWSFHTESTEFFEAMRDLVQSFDKSLTGIGVPPEYEKQRPSWERCEYFTGQFYPQTEEQFHAAKDCINDWVDPLADATVPAEAPPLPPRAENTGNDSPKVDG